MAILAQSVVSAMAGVLLLPHAMVGQAPSLSAGAIYKESVPSVVSIEGRNEKGEIQWTGTGFVVAADGKILTNYHVIRNSKEASVRLSNGDVYDTVEVLDVDRRKDIALLKIKAVDLHPVRIGHSEAVQIGDTVYSLSNPLGLNNTLSDGIVSSQRQLDGFRLLQITAPISHGSSGGPLFNSKGEVVGITQGLFEEGQNLNFAVPIDYARGMLASPGQPRALASVFDPEPENPVATPPANSAQTPKVNPPPPTAGQTIEGAWSATFADAKGSGQLNFNLIQNSSGDVVGTYASSLGGGGTIKGSLDKIDFQFELTQSIQNCPGVYKGMGVMVGDRIAGKYTGSDCAGDRGDGTFVMNRGTGAVPMPGHEAVSTAGQVPNGTQRELADFITAALTPLAVPVSVPSEQEARRVLGDPLSHRYAYDQAQNITGDIYAFRDPTQSADHIELSFDSKTHRMTNMYLYPSKPTTWADCKKLWGDDVAVIKNRDGNKFYSYKNRRVNVLLDKNNKVLSVGLY